MKFRITLKDPNGADASLDHEIERFMELMKESLPDGSVDPEELEQMEDQHRDVVQKYMNMWLRYGEYVTLEIDTDAGTCTVVKP